MWEEVGIKTGESRKKGMANGKEDGAIGFWYFRGMEKKNILKRVAHRSRSSEVAQTHTEEDAKQATETEHQTY